MMTEHNDPIPDDLSACQDLLRAAFQRLRDLKPSSTSSPRRPTSSNKPMRVSRKNTWRSSGWSAGHAAFKLGPTSHAEPISGQPGFEPLAADALGFFEAST